MEDGLGFFGGNAAALADVPDSSDDEDEDEEEVADTHAPPPAKRAAAPDEPPGGGGGGAPATKRQARPQEGPLDAPLRPSFMWAGGADDEPEVGASYTFYSGAGTPQSDNAAAAIGTETAEEITVNAGAAVRLLAEGAKLAKQVEAVTGTRVVVQRSRGEGGDRLVTVFGESQGIVEAVRRIRTFAKAAEQAVTRRLACDAESVGRVIGKGGATIRKLESVSGAKIDVGSGTKGSTVPRTIVVSGDQHAVDAAVRAIQGVVAGDDASALRAAVPVKTSFTAAAAYGDGASYERSLRR